MTILNGIRVLVDPNLTEAGEPVKTKRTWRERLFTLPWRPFMGTKTHIPRVPSRNAIRLPSGDLVVHPAMFEEIKRQVPSKEQP